ncbi:MAG: metallophosphoesterase family protein, partial [Candidatus Omnitrophica bacterium]|nr:metallophosphoesterase family protein [Candidatus Omnitrophota bacterium]
MRYAILSDIHSNLEALEAVLAAFQAERIDAYLCAGDIVGYGANPNECIQRINTVSPVIVAGNHDWAAVGLFPADDFNPEAQEAVAWTRDHLTVAGAALLKALPLVYEVEDLVMVHGSLDGPEAFKYLLGINSCERTFE